MSNENIKDLVNEFDEEHLVKQIILIGVDGAIRNIEFEIMDEQETVEFMGEDE